MQEIIVPTTVFEQKTDVPSLCFAALSFYLNAIVNMIMFLIRYPMVFIFLKLFDLLECLVMLMTLILVIRF